MELNNFNYHSTEANREYMSCSGYKRFAECESLAMAELNGEWTRETSIALQVGTYVDAYFEGSLDAFKEANTSMYLKSGELKAEFRQAENIIKRIQRDEMFMRYMSGEKQVIRTGEIEGVPFKIKMDVLHPGKCIVDLKVMRDFESQYKPEHGRLNFIEYWGYSIQASIYQEVEFQYSGKRLPFYIAAVTKESEPDIGIFQIPQHQLDAELQTVKSNVQHYQQIKDGLFEPERCEKCNYCKHTKKLNRIIDIEELNA